MTKGAQLSLLADTTRWIIINSTITHIVFAATHGCLDARIQATAPLYKHGQFIMSRLPLKSAPLLVQVVFGGRRHRLSSHHQSMLHFRFVLSVLHTPGFNSHIMFLI